jgi:nuclear RNA export factor
MLDQEAIVSITFDAPSSQPALSAIAMEKRPMAKTFPADMGPSFITGVDGSIVSTFLVR